MIGTFLDNESKQTGTLQDITKDLQTYKISTIWRLVYNLILTKQTSLYITVSQGISIGTVSNTDLDEASGLCASRQFPGILYTHNDKGGQNRIFAIDSATAQVLFER
jgi:sporulation protein YlmC with PRC-barrel domain